MAAVDMGQMPAIRRKALFYIIQISNSVRPTPCNSIPRVSLLKDVTTFAANVEEFHSRLSRSLLRLEKHSILFLALWTSLVRSRKRRITTDVLRHTSSFSNVVIEHISEYAGRGGIFGIWAGSASKFEDSLCFVFAWVEHVGAFAAETKGDLLEVLSLGITVLHG